MSPNLVDQDPLNGELQEVLACLLALVLPVAFSVLSGSDNNLSMTWLKIFILLLKWAAYGLSNLQVSMHCSQLSQTVSQI